LRRSVVSHNDECGPTVSETVGMFQKLLCTQRINCKSSKKKKKIFSIFLIRYDYTRLQNCYRVIVAYLTKSRPHPFTDEFQSLFQQNPLSPVSVFFGQSLFIPTTMHRGRREFVENMTRGFRALKINVPT